MKRNQKKETKSRRPLKRFIALWIVFAMLVVPFANHVGKDDAKAEESEDSYKGTIVQLENKDEQIGSVFFSVKKENDQVVDPDVVGSETVTCLKQQQRVSGIWIRRTETQDYLNIIYYKMYDPASDIAASLSKDAPEMNQAMYDSSIDYYIGNFTLEESKKIAIYVANTNEAGEVTSYILYYVLNVEFVNTAFTAGDKKFNGEYMSPYTVNPAAGRNDIAGAHIAYYVNVGEQTETAELTTASNYENKSHIIWRDYRGKDVYVYAALKGVGGILEYKPLGHVHITQDDQPPVISCTKVEESNAEGTFSDIDKAKYFVADAEGAEPGTYYGESDSYKYTFSIVDQGNEETDISGVKTVSAELWKDGTKKKDLTVSENPAGNGTYEITLSKDDAIGGTIKVSATDNAGYITNPVYECPVRIQQVAKGTNVASIAIDGIVTWNGLGTEQLILSKLSAAKRLTVTLKSDKQIDAVTLEKDAGHVLIAKDVKNATRGKDRVYTITATFDIPADTTASVLYKNYVVNAKIGGSPVDVKAPKTMASILYDAEAPKFTAYEIQESADNGVTWTSGTTAISAANGETTYITELDKIYRYAVKVTDAGGSNVKSVYVDNETWTIDGVYYVSPLLTDLSLLPKTVTVTAKDGAGNTNTYQLRSIQKIDEDLVIKPVEMLDATGTPVSQADIFAKKYTNQAYTLRVTAESAYPVAEIGVYADGSYKDVNQTLTNEQDSTTHRYKTTAEFKIPKGIDVNTLLEKLYIIAKDKNSKTNVIMHEVRYPEETTAYLGDVLYDQTKPELVIANEPDSSVWYQEYTVQYELKSGSAQYESPLESAEYTLAGETTTIAVSGDAKSVSGKTVSVPESVTTEGTLLSFTAKDKSGNKLLPSDAVRYIKVDKTRPEIDFDVNGKKIVADPIEGAVAIKANVSDNLTIQTATIRVQGPNTDVTKSVCDAGRAQNNQFTLDNLLGRKAEDGKYTVTVYVADKAGNSRTQSIDFTVDNTIPVVTAKIEDGTTAGKQPGKNFDGTDCDYFYRSNVSVLLTFEDVNIMGSKVTITDNGSRVNVDWAAVQGTNKYQGIYTATGEGAHTIRIDATDEAGNQAVTKQVVFIKDMAAPAITAVINGGMIYNENMGEVDLTSNSVVSFSVNDVNEDVGDFNYQLIKTLPDQLPVTADVLKTDNRSFGFADEADYVVKAYSIDRAGNRSADKTVQFRIDKTAPELTISGAASGSTLKAGTTLTFSMTEAFWKDASGTITITRKASDSAAESTYKTIDFKPTARVTTLTESLTETGEYKVTFTGKDRAGHTAEATSYTVRIDTGKPIITLSGVSNNDKTTKEVEFQAQIDEDFYLTKSVRVNATRTYLDTTSYKEKTENIQVTGYNPSAPSTIIRSIFTEDGVYKLQITCSDAAGNEDTQEVSFTIDKTRPVIDEKVLGAYAGTLTSFAWDYDLNDIIYDLTVCDVHMYLNGSEYDGTSEIEDGAYEMKITAEDELGNKAEETVNFNLDTKAPTFIVTGVEDGEIKNAQYDINVSLQLDEDILDEVSLNGSPIEIKDNAATLTVADKGDYKLTMKAHDAAGNVAEKTIGFTYGEKSHVLLYVLIGVGALVLIGGGGAAFAIAAKKKKGE